MSCVRLLIERSVALFFLPGKSICGDLVLQNTIFCVPCLTSGGIDWQREKWKNGFGSKYIHFGEKIAVKYEYSGKTYSDAPAENEEQNTDAQAEENSERSGMTIPILPATSGIGVSEQERDSFHTLRYGENRGNSNENQREILAEKIAPKWKDQT